MAYSQPLCDKSLPSLQELAKEPLLSVPQRYIQPNVEPAAVLNGSSATSIPVIDMKNLELDNLYSICKEWGIFQLVNHGVSSSLVERLKYEIQEFYKLPLEQKMRYKTKPGDFEGYGKNFLVSEDQKFDWGDSLYMVTNPINKRKPHLLPEFPSSIRDTLETYLTELQKLAMTLLSLMAQALRIDETEMQEMIEDGRQAVRMAYYPPCPQPELVIGLRPHSDASVITILLQVNGVEGLQVKKDGAWIPVKFLPDAFVVNLGDTLEIFSNGLCKSIEHRAMVNSVKERVSIAMFFNPKFEGEVGPAASLVNPQNPPLFKRVGMEKYVKDFFSRTPNGKSFLELMRMQN